MRDANQWATPLPEGAADWLAQRGAVSVRVGTDGVIEFSTRPLREALTAAALHLLGGRAMVAGNAAARNPAVAVLE